jgi:hypothetical protein
LLKTVINGPSGTLAGRKRELTGSISGDMLPPLSSARNMYYTIEDTIEGEFSSKGTLCANFRATIEHSRDKKITA